MKLFRGVAAAIGVVIATITAAPAQTAVQSSNGPVTFAKDIAPIVFKKCAGCHSPTGPAPFSLFTYPAVRQRAALIAEVTRKRIMPPWKAEPGYGDFIGQHPLTDAEIDIIQRWVREGVVEGNPQDLPPPPQPSEGWHLGKPDLIVTPSQPYVLPAEGHDVYHIFVIPIPVGAKRYVKGLELRPGTPGVLHHANIRIDTTPGSRQLDEQDPGPGYKGLLARSATYPDGHFLGWTPGQVAPLLPKGLAWRLDPGTDLVVEAHLMASGKPELVAPSIGFYFTDDPPERVPAILRLGRQSIDIPAGEKNHLISDSYVLPVDVEVQAVQPHAHYRAREVKGIATLPDGTTKWLIYIKDWDFRWQHVFRYVKPFALPKGTTIAMHYIYDNSAENPRNPEVPPRPVHWGQGSLDEMGDLWVQVLTRDERDRKVLVRSFGIKVSTEDIVGYEARIRLDPGSVGLHDDVALLYLDLNQPDKAVTHFEISAKLRPESAAAHFNVGTALMAAGRLAEARDQFQVALQLKPDYGLARNNLGVILLRTGFPSEALSQFREAVRIDPKNAEAHFNLAGVLRAGGALPEAIEQFRQTVSLKPDSVGALANLAWLLATVPVDALRNANQAIELAERAADLTDRQDPTALDILAAAYASAGLFDRAVATTEAALRLAPASPAAVSIKVRQELYKRRRPYVSPAVEGPR